MTIWPTVYIMIFAVKIPLDSRTLYLLLLRSVKCVRSSLNRLVNIIQHSATCDIFLEYRPFNPNIRSDQGGLNDSARRMLHLTGTCKMMNRMAGGGIKQSDQHETITKDYAH